ncbi:hypothetical protein DPMN_095421 [Dreissena polymorpha]|uniref:Uncharacterized protein n=1 Tax=Dreissena polymorpha TaxID=45954 RepID=A0A9D4R4G1_DREPO|nr:hypothetical protein DPMN_095421 [Dreissena polymorpha]
MKAALWPNWSESYLMDTGVISGDKGSHKVEIKRQFCTWMTGSQLSFRQAKGIHTELPMETWDDFNNLLCKEMLSTTRIHNNHFKDL